MVGEQDVTADSLAFDVFAGIGVLCAALSIAWFVRCMVVTFRR